MKKFIFLLLALLPTYLGAATDYYVNNTVACNNSAPPAGYTLSIPGCTILIAGTGGAGRINSFSYGDDDRVIFVAGTYDESLAPSTITASAGHPVIFSGNSYAATIRRANFTGKSNWTIDGLNFTTQATVDANPAITVTGTTNGTIKNFNVHDYTGLGVRNLSTGFITNLTISTGRFYHLYSSSTNLNTTAIQIQGTGVSDGLLVENVDFSRVTDGIALYGVHHYTIRGNSWHDNPAAESSGNAHNDFLQGLCDLSSTSLNPTTNSALLYGVFENNHIYGMPDIDAHGFLVNTTLYCGGASYLIYRYNYITNLAVATYIADRNSSGTPTAYHKFYNNTCYNAGFKGGPPPGDAGTHANIDFGAVTQGSIKNNIFVNCIVNAPSSSNNYLFSLGSSGTNGDHDHNVACFYSTSTSCLGSGPNYGFTTPIISESPSFVGVNPRFVDISGDQPNLHLIVSSPLIDQGNNLTTVAVADTGSGTTLNVTDASFFQCGWGPAVACDFISVGTVGNSVQVTNIDYATNTITLASGISRNDGDPIWLYKDSSGNIKIVGAAPDIGAYDYDNTAPVPGNSGTITVSNIDKITATLDWTKGTSTLFVQNTLQYAIYKSLLNNIDSVANAEANGILVAGYTADINTYNLIGLAPGLTFWVTVIVRDSNLNKAAYTSTSFSTLFNTSPVRLKIR